MGATLFKLALALACLATIPAAAQVKEIEQNDKLRVYEASYLPGAGSPSTKRPMRAVYAISGGTIELTYTNGEKELVEWKTGDTRILPGARDYAFTNVGKTELRFLVVVPK